MSEHIPSGDEEGEIIGNIGTPSSSERLTNQQILLGKKLDPLEIIKIYSHEEWEEFILEWVDNLRGRYAEVRRASGKGDRGRDVIGYVQTVNSRGPWDNYQCKRYDHPLHPSDIWKELAKLLYYTFLKTFSVPRAYYFVAPWGIGPEVLLLVENPEKLKASLISQWQKNDLLKVGRKQILLEGALLQHVESFDFSIVRDLPPSKIIEQHRGTRHHAPRFGGGLVRFPPDKVDVPSEIAHDESRYVEQLFQAYGEYLSQEIIALADLKDQHLLREHFDRQRTHFYLAELLRNFTRDNIPEENCFERLQEAIYDGVIDMAQSQHPNGFERIKKTIELARSLQIDSHPLKECLEGYHRSGICHQLANNDRLRWVP